MSEDNDMHASLVMRTSLVGAVPEEKSSTYKAFWAGAMLFSGTFTTIFAKALFETEANGSDNCNMNDDDDIHCKFNKPWFSVLVMKFSMSLCLLLYYGLGWGEWTINIVELMYRCQLTTYNAVFH